MRSKRKNLQGLILFIKWYDAVSRDAWEMENEPLPPSECISVGICIEHNKECVTLCLNKNPENEKVSCTMTIPLGMIKAIKILGGFDDVNNRTHTKNLVAIRKHR